MPQWTRFSHSFRATTPCNFPVIFRLVPYSHYHLNHACGRHWDVIYSWRVTCKIFKTLHRYPLRLVNRSGRDSIGLHPDIEGDLERGRSHQWFFVISVIRLPSLHCASRGLRRGAPVTAIRDFSYSPLISISRL